MKVPALAIFALLLVTTGGCNKQLIPNTEIEDTEENREIVAFCERYRRAVEDLNVGLLLTLASPRYFDNSGSTTGDDDFDRNGLESVLAKRFQSIQAMRYEIRYRDIYEMDNLIMIDYTYTMSFQYKLEEQSKWANRTADNRLELERVDGGFLIVSGM